MTEKVIKDFEVRYLQVVDESGEADPALFPPISDDLIKNFFEKIILARTFNQVSLSLQREGRLGTYPSIYGQEASQIGSALAVDKEDWVFPTYRELGVLVSLGYPLWMALRYWKGDERGMKIPDGLNIFPFAVPVGTQIPHATGTAWAMKIKGDKRAVVAYFGDGASSRGDSHEGLNFAGVFNVPCVFICVNNQWAISVPRRLQSAAETIAQRAYSYGFEGVQVDGNDVFSVYKAVKSAVDKAKMGGGPTLIECLTYRLDDHTTADDASRYRSEEEVNEWKKKEPLIRLRLFMEKRGLWSKEYEERVVKEAHELVERAVEEEESYPPSRPEEIVLYTNSKPTPRQLREIEEMGWRR